ncbi:MULTISPECIES: MarR family winged helix-turn-helix transcriptional regulator [Nocardioides]|uniref:MarR family winged helix-turn-helix transcriptional regulator n=1 Tax=Nocardioides vastitatis TaxID=2568655 RepID=A0ABW0ZHD1_9ACTN|nr:MarR family transcriptional regulator [Nocardioides sp.]THJ07390.1 MarR family transcriptional regulator [Nocardioides sp.]
MPADHVDRILEQWAQERPDLDVSPVGVIGRMSRVSNRLTDELVAVYATFGLGEGEFDILATLRRSGAPYALSAGELAAATMVTSGAISKRVDRCERRGWVSRSVDDRDGRGRLISLTAEGRALIDEAFSAHMANEHRLVGLLSERDRTLLAAALRRWGHELGID